MGASGLRSSCANSARNSSLRRSASRNASSLCCSRSSASLRSDIACDFRGGDDRSIGGADRRYGQRDGNTAAILGDADGVEVIDALAAPQLVQDLQFLRMQLRGHDDGDRLANHLVRLIAEDARGATVPRKDATFESLADDRVIG